MTQRWFCKHKENIAPNAFWMRLRRHCLHASHYAEQQGGMCHHTWLKRLYIQKKCNYGMVSKSVQSGNTFKATLRSGSSHMRKTPNLVRSNDSWKPKVPLTCYYCYIPCYPTPTVPANWGGCKYFFKTKKLIAFIASEAVASRGYAFGGPRVPGNGNAQKECTKDMFSIYPLWIHSPHEIPRQASHHLARSKLVAWPPVLPLFDC